MSPIIAFSFLLTLTVLNFATESYGYPSYPSESSSVDKIVGGKPAMLGQLPFQLSLQYYGSHFCGAILIKSPLLSELNVAVTAAHCVSDLSTSGLTVMAGSITLEHPSESTQISEVAKIVVHENYGPHNDIAILFLQKSFKPTTNVKAVSLPNKGEEYSEQLIISGWGKTTETGSTISDQLLFANVSLVSNEKCAELYASIFGNDQVIAETNICAGLEQGGKDTCQGDSGGPCVSKDGDTSEPILIGITSWSYGCARPGFPGVYTRAASYVDWIEENVRGNA